MTRNSVTRKSVNRAGFRLALGTLTIVPVGEIGTVSPAVARVAMLAAPAAVLPLAVGAGLICWLCGLLAPPALVTGVLVCGWLGLMTRGMHLDGLADTVDGVAAGWTRERALEVMRSGDVGPMGVATLVLILGGQASAIGALAGMPAGWLAVAWAVVSSRVACAALTVRGLPGARPDGLAAVVANSVPPLGLSLSALIVTGLGICVGWLSGVQWWLPLAAAALGALTLLWLARTAMRKLGGVTGDVIGAGVELTLAALLVVLTCGGSL